MHRPGVQSAVAFAGFDGATFTNAPNAGVIFASLKSFEERVPHGLTSSVVLADLRRALAQIGDAFVLVLEPPSVPGIGTGGGLKGYVEDRAGRGSAALEGATWALAGTAAQRPGFGQVFTLFNTHTPQVYADIDRTKAELLQVPISRSVRGTVGLYRFLLRQRFQPARPHVSGDGAGGQPVPPDLARRREPQDPQQ